MLGSTTSAFSEPEDFDAALRVEGCVSLLITAPGQFQARLTQVSLDVLHLTAVEESLSRIAFVTVPANMTQIVFPIENGNAPIFGGLRMRPGEIMILSPGEQMHARTDGTSHWGAIRISVKPLVKYGAALTGATFSVPPVAQHGRPPRLAGRRLRTLYAAAIRMAAKHPQALANPDAAHGLEQQLLQAAVESLSGGPADGQIRPRRRNWDAMVRFEQLLQSGAGRKASPTQICAALGISERLLRLLCNQHLGMGPTAYDRLRRMTLVRRALRRREPAMGSVSAAARHNDFRDLGRFAINYRAAFGELPSATLRQSRDRPIVASY